MPALVHQLSSLVQQSFVIAPGNHYFFGETQVTPFVTTLGGKHDR